MSLPAILLAALAALPAQASEGELLEATLRADLALARRLLDEDPERVDERDAAKRTPLHLAARAGSLELAELLLERGARLDARDVHSRLPLHYVRDVELARLFLAHGAEPCPRSAWETPFEHAVRTRAHDVVQLYLDCGCELGLADAVWLGRKDLLVGLLAERGVGERGARYPGSALEAAVELGDVEAARLLLDAGADFARGDEGFRPLLLATAMWRRDTGMVRLLLEHGARVELGGELLDHTGFDCLLGYAVTHFPRELARLLCAYAEDLDEPGCEFSFGADRDLPALHHAALAGRVEVARDLLELGASVGEEHAGLTPLRAACLGGAREVVQLLLEHGAASDRFAAIALDDADLLAELLDADPAQLVAPDELVGVDPVTWAASFGSARCLLLLLERGAPPDALGLDSEERGFWNPALAGHRLAVRETRALHAAASGGHLACAELLLEHGADPDAPDAHGSAALYAACAEDRLAMVELLLARGADPDGIAGQRRPPLGLAAGRGRPELARALLAAGADPDLSDETGAAPLDLACIHADERFGHMSATGCFAVARLLLERGARPSFRAACVFGLADELRAQLGADPGLAERETPRIFLHGGRPIEIAAASGAVASLAALRDAGVELVSPAGACVPLSIAADRGHAEAVAWLLDAGAPVDAGRLSGRTALHSAASGGSVEVVALLLARGADPLARTEDGRTALHLAAADDLHRAPERGRLVEVLLAAGCAVDARSGRGQTPLHHAASAGRLDAARALLDAGADVNVLDDEGRTPLRTAREGWSDVQELPAEDRAGVIALLHERGGVE